MQLKVQLYLQEEIIKSETIELSEYKFTELSDDDKEAAVEALIRDWLNKRIAVKWELEEST